MKRMKTLKGFFAMGLLSALLALVACDSQRISELEEGVSTEADVRAKFGEPEKIWDAPNGGRTFEYNRQPNGTQNFMITVGADGKMSALRQVLSPLNFAKVQPGMMMEDVRKMLGKPMKITPFALKNVTHYDWRFQDGPNAADKKIFTAIFDTDLKVVGTTTVTDPALEPNK
jgi:hypothetical protein